VISPTVSDLRENIMENFKTLAVDYLLRGQDPYFSTGRRSNLRFAVLSETAYLTKLNPKGPEPFEYLDYAKSDLASGSAHGYIDALGHAKRAVHLAMDGLLRVWGLDVAYGRANFPAKLELMNELAAFPTRLIGNLNAMRNLVEHEYETVGQKEAADFIDIAEMFLLLAFPFLKKAVISVYAGIDGDQLCWEWRIDHKKKELNILQVHSEEFIDTAIGRVYYHMNNKCERSPKLVVPIKRDNCKEWLPFLDLLVYYTKQLAVKLPSSDSKSLGLNRESITYRFFDLNEGKSLTRHST
jgi:hypothetical protein